MHVITAAQNENRKRNSWRVERAQAAMPSPGKRLNGSPTAAQPVALGSTASPSSRSESPERTSGIDCNTSRCFFRCEGAASAAFLAIFSAGWRLMALEERVRGGVGGLTALTRDPVRCVLATTWPFGVLATLQGAPLVCFHAERCVESSSTMVSSAGCVDDLTTVASAFDSGQNGDEAGSMGADEGRWNERAAGLSAGAGDALLSASASPQMENADIVSDGRTAGLVGCACVSSE